MTETRSLRNLTLVFKPAKGFLVVALAFMILAPSLLATLFPIGRATVSPEILWVFPTAVGMFAVGWLFVGATLRPYGSVWRGAVAAAVLYLLVGTVFVVEFNMAMGTSLLAILLPETIIGGTLLWPLGVAQILGMFGLEFGG